MNYNKSFIHHFFRLQILKLIRKRDFSIYPNFRVRRDLKDHELYQEYKNDEIFVNLGSGEYFYHPRWYNLDIFEKRLVNNFNYLFNYDLRLAKTNQMPFENVSIIYFGHTIEHIPSSAVNDVLRRIYLSLKKGGILRIVCPDADLIYENYKHKNLNFFIPYKSWFQKRGNLEPCLEDYLVQLIATPKSITYTARDNSSIKLSHVDIKNSFKNLNKEMFLDFLISDLNHNNESGTDHLNWFNHAKLEKEVKKAGFSTYKKSNFGQSICSPLKNVPLFDDTLPFLSMYADIIK